MGKAILTTISGFKRLSGWGPRSHPRYWDARPRARRFSSRRIPPSTAADTQDINLLFNTFREKGDNVPLAVSYNTFVDEMTQNESLGPLAGEDFITKMSLRHGAHPREGKRTYDDVLFNKPPPYALGDYEEGPPRAVKEKTTNTPSIKGGIFGPAPPIVAPERPSVKNSSTISLVHAEWNASQSAELAAQPSLLAKPRSNDSSVPGGIFAQGRTEDFRVRGLFVRPGY